VEKMIYKNTHTANADLLIWEITETETQLMQQIEHFERYQQDYQKLKTQKRKLEFLAARVAFQLLTNASETIVYDPDGKPYCESKHYQLSISHTQQWLAVMTHPNLEVGIDIEVPNERFNTLYKRFLNPAEQQFFALNIPKIQLAWSAKEALYKLIGKEAVDFSTQLQIDDFNLASEGQFSATHLVSSQRYLLHYQTFEPFNLVYCIKNESYI
jgi:4'-phosphopantetheinyl transferase